MKPTLVWLRSPVLSGLREDMRFTVKEVENWADLSDVLRHEGPAAVVVLDPYEGATAPVEGFWTVLRRFPSIAFLPVMTLREERVEHVRRMIAAGVSEVLNLDRENTPALLAQRVRSAYTRPLKRRIDAALSPFAPADARIIVAAAIEVAAAGGGAPDLAARFGVMRKTVVSWCSTVGLPPPGRLLAWTRILLAAQLLEDPGRTMRSAAVACGYAADRALRRTIHRFVGTDRGGIDRTELFQAAATALNTEMRELREAHRVVADQSESVSRSGAISPGRVLRTLG